MAERTPSTSEYGRRVIAASERPLTGPLNVDGVPLNDFLANPDKYPLLTDEEIAAQSEVQPETPPKDQSSPWNQLVNQSNNDRIAAQDFAATVAIRADVIKAEQDAPRPWIDPQGEILLSLWGAAVDSATESLIVVKDLSRDVLPLDKILAGGAYVLQGENFFAGVHAADVDNNRANQELRGAADQLAPANETLYGGITRGIATFMVPYMGISKAAGGLSFTQATAAGFALDYTLFDPNEGNLSNLIKELSPDTQSVVLDFLATDPNDSEALNRMRNGLEGGVLGTALEGIFRTARFALGAKKLDEAAAIADDLDYEVDLERTFEPEVELIADDVPAVQVEKLPVDENFDGPFGQGGPQIDTVPDRIKVFHTTGQADDVVLEVRTPADAKGQGDAIFTAVTREDAAEFGRRAGPGRTIRELEVDTRNYEDITAKLDNRPEGQSYGEAKNVAQDEARAAGKDGVIIRGSDLNNPEVNIFNTESIVRGNSGPVPEFEKLIPDVDKTKSAKAAQADEGVVLDEIDLESDLRSTLRITDEQAAAYVKALEAGDTKSIDNVLNDFNESNFDWDKIESPDDIKTIIRVTSELFAEHIDTVKGGVQGHTQTKRLANLVGATGEEVHKLFNDVRGDKGITARMHAAERTLISSARRLYDLREIVKANPADVAAKSNFYRQMQLHAALQAEVKGAKTEIARALNGMAILKADADEGFAEFNDVLRQMGGPSSSRPADFERFMDDLLDGRNLSDLNAKIRQTAGQRFKNVVVEFVINSMLSSLKTHAINLTSNTLNTFLYTADRFIGGSYRYLRGDKRLLREARLDLFGKVKSLDEAWNLAKQAWVDGAPVTDKRQRLEFNTRKAISMDGESWLANTVNTLGTIVRVPGRALITGDEFFKAINRNAEIDVLAFRKADEEASAQGIEYGSEAYEKFVTKRTQVLIDPDNTTNTAREIRSRAIEKSRLTTFQESAKTNGGQAVERAVNSNAFVKLVLAPFFRTPMNILRQGIIDRTPLGLTIGEARDQILRGTANQRAEAVARMTTGMAAMTAGYSFIAAGGEDKNFEIVGRRPFDSSARVDAVQDYSIRVGDTWYQFNRLDPLGMWLGMMADMEQSARHFDQTDPEAEGRTFALMQGAMAGFYNNVANKTWMKSLADLLEMGEGFATNKPTTVARAWGKFSSGQIGKFIPALVKSTGTALQGERTAREAWTFMDGLTAQIPFMSEDLPVRHDILGRPMTREMSALSVINPFATSPTSDDPVDKEFARLAFSVRPMPRSLGSGSMQLNAEEYSQLTGMVANDGLEERLRALITRDDWESKTPERRVFEIKKHIEIARTAARLRFISTPEMRKRFRDENFSDLRSLISPTTP
jgi:hypothetical protein